MSETLTPLVGEDIPLSPEANVPDAAAREKVRARFRDYLSKDELADLLEVSAWRGWLTIATNWGIVAATFWVVAEWTNPLTIVLALVILGTRQLGCAIVMHEASHRTLFKSRKLNDWAGNWLAAYPIWSEVEPYRNYHLVHHAHTGGPGDPDLALSAPFPITRGSMWRKVWRDLSGQTGWKQARAVATRDLGWTKRKTQRNQGLKRGQQADVGWHKVAPVAITNAVILAALTVAGHPALYLLWVVAWLTTYRLVMRIRSIAEHAMPGEDPLDPFQNTRTTLASWWERLAFAPNRVNYHLEHHLLMTVPLYNLPKMHRMLRSRGAYEGALIANGYAEVLREATSRAA